MSNIHRRLLIAGLRAVCEQAGTPAEPLENLPEPDLQYLAHRCRVWLVEVQMRIRFKRLHQTTEDEIERARR